MSVIIKLKELELKEENIKVVGGKAYNLAKMLQAGLLVPDAFVVVCEWLEVHEFEMEIYRAREALESTYVAVRSSATVEDSPYASFAGQYDSFLFINDRKLIQAILDVQRSLLSLRSEAYQEGGDFGEIKMGVIVQAMVEEVKSAGVMYTQNPFEQNNSVIIESTWGLGECVVQGSVTPDSFVVSRDTGEIEATPGKKVRKKVYVPHLGLVAEEKTTQTEQENLSLSDEEVKQLVELGLQIEEMYDSPMDVEWAVDEDGKIFIVQARPITM
jgi:pyruvate,water dikinase